MSVILPFGLPNSLAYALCDRDYKDKPSSPPPGWGLPLLVEFLGFVVPPRQCHVLIPPHPLLGYFLANFCPKSIAVIGSRRDVGRLDHPPALGSTNFCSSLCPLFLCITVELDFFVLFVRPFPLIHPSRTGVSSSPSRANYFFYGPFCIPWQGDV